MASISSSDSTLNYTEANDLTIITKQVEEKLHEYKKSLDEYAHFIQSAPQLPIDVENSKELLKMKKSFVDSLIKQLKNATPGDFPKNHAQLYCDIVVGLTKETRDTKNLMVQTKHELEETENAIASMEKEIELLKNISSKREVSGEMKKMEELDVTASLLHRVFQKHKKVLHHLIAEVFSTKSEEVHHILSDLTRAYFDPEADNYIEFTEEYDISLIELLLNADVISRHPQDETKFQLFC